MTDQNIPQIQPQAAAAGVDLIHAAKQALACMDGLMQHLGQSICCIEAEALRTALAATPAAASGEYQPIPVQLLPAFKKHADDAQALIGKIIEKQAASQAQADARERMTAGHASFFMERFLKEEKLLGPNEQAALHFVIDMLEAAPALVVLPEEIPASNTLWMFLTKGMTQSAIAGMPERDRKVLTERAQENWAAIRAEVGATVPVVLPEPIPQWLRDMEWCVIEYDRSGYSQAWCPQCGGCKTDYFGGKAGHKDGCEFRALLATGGHALERGEVLVTVSGFTGSGKSAVAGEIEIMCRALGLQVEWPDGSSEKNMTHADWTTALDMYKPRVRIIEKNITKAATA